MDPLKLKKIAVVFTSLLLFASASDALARGSKRQKEMMRHISQELRRLEKEMPWDSEKVQELNDLFEREGNSYRIEGKGSKRLYKFPKLKVAPLPVYPTHFVDVPDTVKVTIRLFVNSDGLVSSVGIVESSDNRYEENILEAMQKWEFKPSSYDGQSLPFRIQISVIYTIMD